MYKKEVNKGLRLCRLGDISWVKFFLSKMRSSKRSLFYCTGGKQAHYRRPWTPPAPESEELWRPLGDAEGTGSGTGEVYMGLRFPHTLGETQGKHWFTPVVWEAVVSLGWKCGSPTVRKFLHRMSIHYNINDNIMNGEEVFHLVISPE